MDGNRSGSSNQFSDSSEDLEQLRQIEYLMKLMNKYKVSGVKLGSIELSKTVFDYEEDRGRDSIIIPSNSPLSTEDEDLLFWSSNS